VLLKTTGQGCRLLKCNVKTTAWGKIYLVKRKVIEQCLNNNRQAQYQLYEKYSPGMFGICLRYAKNSTDAEDILQEGFIKVFRY